MRRVFLGVDCGTQATKAILRDATTGAVVAVGRAPHKLIARDDGTSEQDPAWWIDALRTAAPDAFRGDTFYVAGIGVSGQQHGPRYLDHGHPPGGAGERCDDT